jgi:sugar (pentulose or hexulose) kinase
MPLQLSSEPEAGLKGAALLASAGVGLVDDLTAEARKRRVTEQTVLADPTQAQVYAQVLDEYVRVYDHMLGFWQDR